MAGALAVAAGAAAVAGAVEADVLAVAMAAAWEDSATSSGAGREKLSGSCLQVAEESDSAVFHGLAAAGEAAQGVPWLLVLRWHTALLLPSPAALGSAAL